MASLVDFEINCAKSGVRLLLLLILSETLLEVGASFVLRISLPTSAETCSLMARAVGFAFEVVFVFVALLCALSPTFVV